MARGVEQRELHVRGFDHRRFGEDCDAALTFDLIRVEERVAVIDAAELTRDAGVVEERFDSVVLPASTCATMPATIRFISLLTSLSHCRHQHTRAA